MKIQSRFIVLNFIFFFISSSIMAQEEPDSLDQISTGEDPPAIASPSVEGNRKAKGIEINYNRFAPFNIVSDSRMQNVNDAEGELKSAKSLEFKLKAPIILRPKTKLLTGVSYLYEEYKFRSPNELNYGLYKNLEDKHLHSVSLDFYFIRSLNERNFFLSKAGLELNGDFSNNGPLPFTRFIKYSASGLYGWKKNRFTSYGLGVYLSYTFGRPRIYPAFMWNHTINDKWGIEALLPANFFLRRYLSQKSILLLGYDVEGASYHIVVDDPPLSEIKTLELRKSDIRVLLTFEREIYDFLWFSVSAGYRFNINLNVSENNSFNNDVIIENKIENRPFIGLSLFAVPPKKLSTKFIKDEAL